MATEPERHRDAEQQATDNLEAAYYTDAELAGRVCISCGEEFVNVVTQAIDEAPDGSTLFVHADLDDCKEAAR